MPSDDLAVGVFTNNFIHKQILRKLAPPSGNAAVFDDRDFKVGRIKTDDGWLLCLFNWGDTETRSCAALDAP